jgi:hypothetical protein
MLGEFEKTGKAEGLTFRQAAGVIARATGNDVEADPFSPADIRRAKIGFGDDNSGQMPDIRPRDGGGFDYITISGRIISVYPGKEGWTLDCSEWWNGSRYFRSVLVECLSEVLKDENLRDPSLPEPLPPHECVREEEAVKGKIFRLYCIPPNTHGCWGEEVEVEALSPTEGVVKAGERCLSCSDGSSPIRAGTKVRVPQGFCWLCASEEDIEALGAREGRSRVSPGDLLIQ